MKLKGYYSSGEFARMAHVSVRTIRFYDKQNILKPSYVNPAGARFYTDADFARLQQILLLKYLGFTLDDIRQMLVADMDYHFMLNSLKLQKKLVQDRIEQMQLVEQAIENTAKTMEKEHQIDGSRMLELIHLTGMETSLKTQYQDAGNISARIRLHRDFSTNRQGWFPWLFCQTGIQSGMDILELGCGNGAFWMENQKRIPENVRILLSDISEGMLRDARRNVIREILRSGEDTFPKNDALSSEQFSFALIDAHEIPYPENSFDLVIANHILFYCEDISRVCREVLRVMKPQGRFICSTYGQAHMREITELVQEFDDRIVLSAEKLYDKFGLENGRGLLHTVFPNVECRKYEDEIRLDQADPLVEYILSCHGNQNQILLERYKEFRSFAEKKVRHGFHITKDAGIFICCNN